MNNLSSPLSTLATIVFIASAMLILWLVLRPTIFSPLQLVAFDHRFTRRGAERSRFRLVEFAMLLVQLNATAALLAALPLSPFERATLIGCSWLIMLVWWWEGVTLLSHAQVTTPRDRLFFLGVLTPVGGALATLLAVLAPAVPIGFVFLLCIAIVDGNAAALLGGVALLALGTLHAVGVAWARQACQSIAARAELAPAAGSPS